ncbi:hypothetical protein [Flavitalea sp.]|nr:hypothetical protein [Flavitalea sp.]
MNPVSNIAGSTILKKTCLLTMMLTINLASYAQVIANWTFTGTITGSAGSFNTISIADFSPAVPTRAFNGGTEYYGHDGWPAGTLAANFYLSFTLSPNIGLALNILSLNLRMRHSNTGSSGGSGPTQFTVRSSLDGYTTNLATGSLTGAYSNFVFAPGAAFNNLPAPVTFRIYGHNAVLYSGGNNRFVFDNIQVDAIGIVLPLKLLSFKAIAGNGNVALQYHLNDVAAETHLVSERSTDNRVYKAIASEVEIKFQANKIYTQTDIQIPPGIDILYYRLRIIEPDGNFFYSTVVPVKIKGAIKSLTVIYSRNMLKFQGLASGASRLMLYNSSGNLVFSCSLVAGYPGQTINSVPSLPKGIYYIKIVGLNVNQEASFLS